MFQPVAWLSNFLGSRRRLPPDVRCVAEFRKLLKKERLRADRAPSMFSLLAIEPPSEVAPAETLRTLAWRVTARVRATDDVGLLADGRLGVFLPDTPAAGAWQVAEDLLATYAQERVSPSCEVYVYPCGPKSADDNNAFFSNDHEKTEPVPVSSTLNGAAHGSIAMNGSIVASAPRATWSKSVFARALPAERLLVSKLPWWKRGMDLLGASLACLALSPLFVLAALAIKITSRGGVFFTQYRDGLGGRPFRMLKFRTMRLGADDEKQALRQHSEQDGPAFKIKDDPRLTTVGRFLRATSIDELPQLWNVLRGEMSLVGPRPLPCDESARCRRWQRRRLEVTPGLTCIWQVSGRNLLPFEEWMRMDLRYVDGRSFWTDLNLLLWTIPAVLSRKGAM
jgi:lipopolysaccharide/colanic/teichoic acid biosynthesis glycosyltransferase